MSSKRPRIPSAYNNSDRVVVPFTLSEGAAEQLVLAAVDAGFIRSKYKANGLGLYLDTIAQANEWVDNRPSHMRVAPSETLLHDWSPYPRTVRFNLAVQCGTVTTLAEVATRFNMRRSHRKTSDLTQAANAVEALGLRYLLPAQKPLAPKRLTKYYYAQVQFPEVDW